MEHTYQSTLLMPASYAVLAEDEMTYIEGGAFTLNITTEQVASFAANVVINALGMMGSAFVTYGYSTIKEGMLNGLTVGQTIDHTWSRMNTWSRIAMVGLAGLGGYYVYGQVVGVVRSVKNLVDAVKESWEESKAQTATPAVATPAVAA